MVHCAIISALKSYNSFHICCSISERELVKDDLGRKSRSNCAHFTAPPVKIEEVAKCLTHGLADEDPTSDILLVRGGCVGWEVVFRSVFMGAISQRLILRVGGPTYIKI